MKLYSCDAVTNLIHRYVEEKGGEQITVEEGVLGFGLTILKGDGFKSVVITEVPTSCWSCGHKIRLYNKLPKKYEQMLEKGV